MSVSTYDSIPFTHDAYRAAPDRYRGFGYRRVGCSGLQLPPISLGFFGDDRVDFYRGTSELEVSGETFKAGLNSQTTDH
jgi:hypothetical protein